MCVEESKLSNLGLEEELVALLQHGEDLAQEESGERVVRDRRETGESGCQKSK
jgi:hypothetical protein